MGIFHQKHDDFFNFSVCNIETIRFLVICGLFLGVFYVGRCWRRHFRIANGGAPLVAKFEVSSLRLTACFASRLRCTCDKAISLLNQRVTLARAIAARQIGRWFPILPSKLREFHSGYEITPLNLRLESEWFTFFVCRLSEETQLYVVNSMPLRIGRATMVLK